jgi:hypothetical protein
LVVAVRVSKGLRVRISVQAEALDQPGFHQLRQGETGAQQWRLRGRHRLIAASLRGEERAQRRNSIRVQFHTLFP